MQLTDRKQRAEDKYRGAAKALPSRVKQSGSTLVISLIILIILMLLGITAMNISDTQYKLAGNLQFENMAMNDAETKVNAAEQWLEAHAGATPSVGAVPNAFDPFAITSPYVIGYVSTNASPLAGVGLECSDPGNEHNFDCVHTYLITARGTGGRGATKFVQVYYAVPLK